MYARERDRIQTVVQRRHDFLHGQDEYFIFYYIIVYFNTFFPCNIDTFTIYYLDTFENGSKRCVSCGYTEI